MVEVGFALYLYAGSPFFHGGCLFFCVLGSAKAKSSTALTWKTVFNKESISNGVSWQGVMFCIFCHGCQGGSNVKRGVPLGTSVA